MNYWLLKSDLNAFSIELLKKTPKQTTYWDGVRNYQARNMLRDQIQKSDLAFFYHSNCEPPGIAGIVEIVREGYPDFTAFDPEDKHYDPKSNPDQPTWYMVDVKFKQQFSRIIGIDELRQVPALQDMVILRKGNRLSITPVTKKEWDVINKLIS